MTVGAVVDGPRADRVVVRILEAPIADPVPMSFSRLSARRSCLVEVWADGAVGVGESWINYPDWAASERTATLSEGVAPLVLGEPVGDPSAVLARIVDALGGVARQWGAVGPIWQAASAVDQALWDLLGRAAGTPVGRMLGAARDSAPVYASGVGPTLVEELCARTAELGIGAVKAKVGFDEETDLATIRTIRRELPDVRIFADANCAWRPDEAVRRASALRDAGVEWLEEPLVNCTGDALAALHAATGMQLAAGENVYGADDLVALSRVAGIAHVQPDVAKSGGISVAAQVARELADGGPLLSPHWYAGAVGLRASLAIATGCERAGWVEYDVRANPLRDELLGAGLALDAAGRLPASEVPGLCSDLDIDRVEHHTVHRIERSL